MRRFDSDPRLQKCSSTFLVTEVLRCAQDFACGLPLRSRPQTRLKFDSDPRLQNLPQHLL